MSNSVFGKTQENLRNRMNVELITKENILKKRVANPRFKRGIEISENLVAVQSKITTLMLNRPIYVGLAVLELSKLHMYNFHYEEMKIRYPNAKLLFTDTDSLTYLVQTEDIYKDMVDNMLHGNQLYDMSDYPNNHSCFQDLNSETIKNIKQVKEVLKRNQFPEKTINSEIKKYLNKIFEPDDKQRETLLIHLCSICISTSSQM